MLDTRIPVGKMEINKLGSLNRIGGGAGSTGGPSLTELDLDTDDEDGKGKYAFMMEQKLCLY